MSARGKPTIFALLARFCLQVACARENKSTCLVEAERPNKRTSPLFGG